MEKFYIQEDDQQQGPFSIEELKELKITRETMTWYEGVADWKEAGEIEELKELFKSIPPPLKSNPKVLSEIRKDKTKLILFISALVIALVGILVYQNQQAKIESKINQQSLQLQDQNWKIQQQESAEEAQKAEADKKQRAADLATLQSQYDNALNTLRKCQIQLNDDQKFKLLRTPAEKQSELDRDLESIRNWEKEVDRLKKEIKNY